MNKTLCPTKNIKTLVTEGFVSNDICSVDCYPSISMATHHISLSYPSTYQLALILHRFIIPIYQAIELNWAKVQFTNLVTTFNTYVLLNCLKNNVKKMRLEITG